MCSQMEIKNVLTENKDGVETRSATIAVPSTGDFTIQKVSEESVKKRRRRGKSKRKIMKPILKVPWQNRRRNEKQIKRNNRFRKIVLTKTHAPYNNNQFLMEIHKPEPENNFQILQTPARTRDSSFSVDSDENYFYSLPEDEEDYLTKEFSSVYEDAQSERLSNMSKTDLIQEYLLLEAKYDTLVKRTELAKQKNFDDEKDTTGTDKDVSATDKSMASDHDTSGTSLELSTSDEITLQEIVQRVKDQEEQIHELKIANEKLRLENEHLSRRSCHSSSEDSESDSSSTSVSSDNSHSGGSTIPLPTIQNVNDSSNVHHNSNEINGAEEHDHIIEYSAVVNGFHEEPNDMD